MLLGYRNNNSYTVKMCSAKLYSHAEKYAKRG